VNRDLAPLFDPGSIAVVGASNDPATWGHALAQGALRGRHRRDVYLVNRNAGEILGEQSWRSLAELPGPAELVVVAVPERAFETTVDEALAAGARAIVAITAGLGETGPSGAARERHVASRVRDAGAVLLGPNCLGVFDAGSELDVGWSELPRGSIGLVSQSGNLALELGLLVAEVGLGFSRFASLGNQADLEAAHLVRDLAGHEQTRVICLYLEDFRDGRAFARACLRATEAAKPVILLAAGRSAASTRAARSHTGALVSDRGAIEAACRAAGIELVHTPAELVDLAQAFLVGSLPRGRRVAVFGDGGGHGVIAADLAVATSLEVPALSPELSAALAGTLGPTAVTGNPVDLAGGGEDDVGSFERVARLLLESGEVDAAVLTGYFGGYAEYGPDHEERECAVARAMAEAAADADRPLVAQTMYPRGPAARTLREHAVPVFGDIGAALSALARLAHRAEEPPSGVPEPSSEPAGSPAAEGYLEARELLAAAGLPFVEARRAETREAALSAAAELGYPVVLKALGLLHKSDAGGVAVGIPNEAELERSLTDMATRLSPPGYSVERTADVGGGVELIVGARRDPRFGPVALAGLGGVYAELLGDVAVALAPVAEADAERLLRSLRGARLLAGARGRPPVDLPAAARALAALSRVAAAHPEIAEIEINPLLVTPGGALGLDARLVLLAEEGEDDAR
jgi:acyl-CoA synthetase (NDP forming)